MSNSFTLKLVEPAVIQRIGKLEEALEISTKVEDGVRFTDGSYIEMTIQETKDSSYVQGRNFYFPLQIIAQRRAGRLENKKLSSACIVFWKRDDGQCLVMLRRMNLPEHNPECDYQEAITKIVDTLKAQLAC